MKVIINGSRFTEKEFDEMLELFRQVNPVMADALEGAVTFEDD